MRLRLTQEGFEHYNGQMGVVFFEDGISTNHVSTLDAVRISAVYLCEWEDGRKPSISHSIVANADTPAPMFANDGTGSDNDREAADNRELAAIAEVTADTPATLAVDITEAARVWTEDQLAAVADKEGIKGLRAIADEMGIKGNSIKELMAAILKKRG